MNQDISDFGFRISDLGIPPWLFGVIFFVVVFGIFLAVISILFRRAPLGYEDRNGFHFGNGDELDGSLSDFPPAGSRRSQDFPPTHKPTISGGASPVAERSTTPRYAGEASPCVPPARVADSGQDLPAGSQRSQDFSARDENAPNLASPATSHGAFHANRSALIPF